jgi:SAM-dependent methyltransferase/uncharacterized protein YbaR (Trm112 family)
MRTEAVDYFVCPRTGAKLSARVGEREGDRILAGELVSEDDGGCRYKVVDGVPRFVSREDFDDEQKDTVNSFSAKWSRIPNYAFEEKTKGNREAWFFERFGFSEGDSDLVEFLTGCEHVLEAGVGVGVDTDLLARNSSAVVFGVDISDSIDIAQGRFRDRNEIVLAQADLGRLPFAPGFFDVIVCDQVLHHTPDPRTNFSHLIECLGGGGRILLYVYREKGALREFCDDHLRSIHTKSDFPECVAFCEKITRLGRDLSRLGARINIDEDIPELGIVRGEYDLQRLIYDHIVKCFWNDDYDFNTNVMVNLDWYRPQTACRYTPDEIRQWCAEEGLELQRLHVCPSGISLIARKNP